jgi:hypothetical protein
MLVASVRRNTSPPPKKTKNKIGGQATQFPNCVNLILLQAGTKKFDILQTFNFSTGLLLLYDRNVSL